MRIQGQDLEGTPMSFTNPGIWRRGLEHKDKVSAACRAVDIGGIHELAAPIPGAVNTASPLEFLRAVRELVRTAVIERGGVMLP